jgi:two-component system phosphate regulon sensor histidine kinase PhoR
VRFQTKIFLSSLPVAAGSLSVAVLLISWSVQRQMQEGLERNLIAEARLAAELLADRAAATRPSELDEEADALGASIGARVTLIGPDGTVLGDSSVDGPALIRLENHLQRIEVQEALENGVGVSRRFSTTIDVDLLYVAARVGSPTVAVVRLAMPLTDVRQQVRSVWRLALLALFAALAGAGLLAWAMSAILSRRVLEIAATARRYGGGDFTRPVRHYGDDEIGEVARALDDSVQELGRRMADLARDRARMEAILAGMVEGVLVVNEAGVLQSANDAARRMLRLGGTALGQHYVELIRHPEVVSRIAHALDGLPSPAVELSLAREPDRTAVARAAPVVSPAASGAVLVLHDITDLRRVDQIRRDFVANVSHELRTPLTAIRGYTEALLEAPVGDLSSENRRFVEIIARHAGHMERLVKDLLRLARLDAGQEPIEPRPCATRGLVDEVLEDLAEVIAARGHEVEVDIAPEAATIVVDPTKWHDVLRNLIRNAASHAPGGTAITIAARRRDDRIEITVADRGPGIPDADLSRVFERFYRVDKARSRDPGGTGLGLAIVKHLVNLHGGEVRAGNRPGGGAVFSITIPGSQ